MLRILKKLYIDVSCWLTTPSRTPNPPYPADSWEEFPPEMRPPGYIVPQELKVIQPLYELDETPATFQQVNQSNGICE
jgi:hypothetical protein